MKLTYASPKKSYPKKKNLFYVMEFIWNTGIPMLAIYLGTKHHWVFYALAFMCLFRLRPEKEDL